MSPFGRAWIHHALFVFVFSTTTAFAFDDAIYYIVQAGGDAPTTTIRRFTPATNTEEVISGYDPVVSSSYIHMAIHWDGTGPAYFASRSDDSKTLTVYRLDSGEVTPVVQCTRTLQDSKVFSNSTLQYLGADEFLFSGAVVDVSQNTISDPVTSPGSLDWNVVPGTRTAIALDNATIVRLNVDSGGTETVSTLPSIQTGSYSRLQPISGTSALATTSFHQLPVLQMTQYSLRIVDYSTATATVGPVVSPTLDGVLLLNKTGELALAQRGNVTVNTVDFIGNVVRRSDSTLEILGTFDAAPVKSLNRRPDGFTIYHDVSTSITNEGKRRDEIAVSLYDASYSRADTTLAIETEVSANSYARGSGPEIPANATQPMMVPSGETIFIYSSSASSSTLVMAIDVATGDRSFVNLPRSPSSSRLTVGPSFPLFSPGIPSLSAYVNHMTGIAPVLRAEPPTDLNTDTRLDSTDVDVRARMNP